MLFGFHAARMSINIYITICICNVLSVAHLSDLILYAAAPVRPLQSSDVPLLSVLPTTTELAPRPFSVAAPHTWTNYRLTFDLVVL